MTGVFDYEKGIGTLGALGDQPQMLLTKDGTFVGPAPNIAPGDLDVYGAVLEGTGKKWVQQSDATHSFGFVPPFVGDPNDLLRLLRGATDVERLEAGVERGADVMRYRARLDVDRAIAELPEDTRQDARATIRQYWTDGAKDGIPLELSIDAQDRLRNLSFDVPDGENVRIEFFKYGIDPGVETPPMAEVMSTEEFNARAKSLCSEFNRGESAAAACMMSTILEPK